MAHFDMSNGTMVVNGITSNVFCAEDCKICGQLSYTNLFKLSNNVTPRDSWFPASFQMLRCGMCPLVCETNGPFPQLTAIYIQHEYLSVYSTSKSNSVVLTSGSNLSNNSSLCIKPYSEGFIVEKIS
jgi:hypothetical protein